jgi:uncharacterized membrane protein
MKKRVKTNHNKPPILKRKLTFSQKAADKLTRFVGCWSFIIGLLIFIGTWIALNVYLILIEQWDPYPFILLNFVLSCLAAIQAPIILMSQNRAAERDRLTAKYDYMINRKAEREVANMQKDLDEIKELIRGIKK